MAIALQVGLSIALAAHFVCVDVAMAGPLFALWLAGRERRRGDPMAGELGGRLMHLAWQSLAVGIVLGLLAGGGLWLSGSERFFTALARVPADRLYWGVAELAVYFCLVVPCAFGWDRLRQRPIVLGLLAITATADLVYHFPPLFVAISELAPRRPETGATISLANFRRLMFEPEVLSRVAHHLLSAAAAGGMLVMGLAARRSRMERNAVAARGIRVGGGRLALAATLLQIPIGLWLLSGLPAAARDAVLGSDPVATGLFLLSMAATLGLLHYLAAAATGDAGFKEVLVSWLLLLCIIGAMTGTLRRAQERAAAVAGRIAAPRAGPTGRASAAAMKRP